MRSVFQNFPLTVRAWRRVGACSKRVLCEGRTVMRKVLRAFRITSGRFAPLSNCAKRLVGRSARLLRKMLSGILRNLFICLTKSDLSTQFWVYMSDKRQFL